MHTVEAIDSDSLTGVGVALIVGLVIVGLVLGLLIAKFIARLVIALVVVALAITVWVQRDKVEDKLKSACNSSVSFFGIDVQPSDDLKRDCDRSAG